MVATCVGIGGVDADYAAAREEMRAYNIQNGFTNVEYSTFSCVLVESGRDAIAMHALQQNYDYVLQIDADAAPFPPNALVHLLRRAFVDLPDADVVGAYCQIKHAPYLPTIDTGTGRWEEHYPGEGVLPVIRTGCHFHLTKVSAYRRFGPPWYRTRLAPSPIQALAEVDGFARQHLDGRNPFAGTQEWEYLTQLAKERSMAPSPVGEDSAFCDALLAAGGRIYVDCDLVAGHMVKVSVTPDMLKSALEGQRALKRASCGVL